MQNDTRRAAPAAFCFEGRGSRVVSSTQFLSGGPPQGGAIRRDSTTAFVPEGVPLLERHIRLANLPMGDYNVEQVMQMYFYRYTRLLAYNAG